MAEHKVPQDVEADDKLLGPLSFRQFIYAMIALGGAAMTYFILSANIILPIKAIAIAPILVFICFGTLAIPRKGQPMETYIGALIHFYFQPTRRLWDPDGQESLVEITNPTIDPMLHKVKEIGGAEAAQRLSFLADVEDSQGWSTRGNVNLNDDYALAANMAVDVFDDSSLNEELSLKLEQTEARVRKEAVARMSTPASAQQAGFAPPIYATSTTPSSAVVTPPPMPVEDEATLSAMLKQSAASSGMTAFRQTVIQPPGSSPVLDNPTIVTTATPVATSNPTAQPPLPAPEPKPAPMPEPLKPGIIDTNPGNEKAVSRDVGTDSNQGVEVSLH